VDGQPINAAELFGAGIDTRDAAWRVVRGLFEGFGGAVTDNDGYSVEEIAAAAVPIPPALADLYQLFGRRSELISNQDRLLGPHQISIDDGVAVIRHENQSVASWGIPVERLREDDPPVVFEHGDGWRPYFDRLSVAAVEFALTEAVLGGDLTDNACELTDDLIVHVRSRYTRVAFPEYVNWASDDASPICWFSAPGKLLRIDGPAPYPWLFVRGRTTAELVELCTDIPGDWAQSQGTAEDDI
jgi:hypothetical protein